MSIDMPVRKGPEIHTSYLRAAFDRDKTKEIVGYIVKDLRSRLKEFDAIAFRGLSGSLMVPIISFILKKPMIAVRKETCHSHYKVEGVKVPRYIIMDDFWSSGGTCKEIIEQIKTFSPSSTPVAMYFWSPSYGNSHKTRLDLPVWGHFDKG